MAHCFSKFTTYIFFSLTPNTQKCSTHYTAYNKNNNGGTEGGTIKLRLNRMEILYSALHNIIVIVIVIIIIVIIVFIYIFVCVCVDIQTLVTHIYIIDSSWWWFRRRGDSSSFRGRMFYDGRPHNAMYMCTIIWRSRQQQPA